VRLQTLPEDEIPAHPVTTEQDKMHHCMKKDWKNLDLEKLDLEDVGSLFRGLLGHAYDHRDAKIGLKRV
jgi:hypothetical protein